jgi:hypothetical protein
MKSAAALRIFLIALVVLARWTQPTSDANSMAGTVPSMVEQAVADSAGVLTGSVTKGPLAPAQRPGTPSGSGVPNARIDIATLDGKPVASAETDSAGTFRVDLPAGTYKITMPSLYGAMFSKDLPAIVSIGAGEKKRLDIHLDTGIR